jgi:SAM-dependent methyltransferase
MPPTSNFADHFSVIASHYASARPEYPPALFEWIASIAPARDRVWEAGCGSGQATRGLASWFATVYASDPSAAQIAQARAPENVVFAVEPAETCGLPDASVDAVCVAQALHWFDRPRFFAECARVLKPNGVLVVWGYQDIEPFDAIRDAVAMFAAEIAADWPGERAFVDRAYADFECPFAAVETSAPLREIAVEWPLSRLLAYFSSYSATKRYRERTGRDPVAAHAAAIAAAWGDPADLRPLRWPLFVHAYAARNDDDR